MAQSSQGGKQMEEIVAEEVWFCVLSRLHASESFALDIQTLTCAPCAAEAFAACGKGSEY